ncbi:MAG: single-stranded DNA-binding protein [Bacteroidales bacterium]|nr:single-stranded DNA-binding protein [Bacteroidales bacterium]MDD3201111.1 single-stranded DNA-binding protein [Bacteroidales bacterium]
MALNKALLIGNVGKDPEVRHLEGGASVATFTLATTERYKDRNGEMKENTEWHNIVAWRQLAELASNYIKKGTQIYVEGRIRSRSWDDQNGNKRYTTEIIADSIQLLGRKSDNEQTSGAGYGHAPAPVSAQSQPAHQAAPAAPAQAPVNDSFGGEDQPDDLPF